MNEFIERAIRVLYVLKPGGGYERALCGSGAERYRTTMGEGLLRWLAGARAPSGAINAVVRCCCANARSLDVGARDGRIWGS